MRAELWPDLVPYNTARAEDRCARWIEPGVHDL